MHPAATMQTLCWSLSVAVAGAMLLAVVGCREHATSSSYVARVGDQHLTQDALQETLETLPALQDSTEAQQQIIDRWITNALLYEEAERRGLADDPEVKERLEESRRSVLISALIDRIYDEADLQPSESELRAYFDQHREELRLREPYVQVRYLSTPDAAVAREVGRALQNAGSGASTDSAWTALAREHAEDPDRALRFSSNYYPESRLFEDAQQLRAMLGELETGEVAPVFQADGRYHLLQLVERVPAGATPALDWVRDEVQRRFAMQRRKQMYARQVQRLRNEALSRGALDVRPDTP